MNDRCFGLVSPLRAAQGGLAAAGGLLLALSLGCPSPQGQATALAPPDVPQVALRVSFPGLDAKSREALGSLQESLAKLEGIRLRGPLDLPIYVPGQTLDAGPAAGVTGPRRPTTPPDAPPAAPGAVEQAKPFSVPRDFRLHSIPEDALAGGLAYFGVAGYMSPRFLDAAGTSAVFRLAPAKGRAWPAGFKDALQAVLDAERGAFTTLQVYAPTLGWEDAAARTALDAEFGHHTLWVALDSEDGGLWRPATLEAIEAKLRAVDDPRVRSTASDAAFVRYGMAVQKGLAGDAFPFDRASVPMLVFAATQGGYTPLTDGEGRRTFVEFNVTADGAEGLALERALAKALAGIEGVTARPNRGAAAE